MFRFFFVLPSCRLISLLPLPFPIEPWVFLYFTCFPIPHPHLHIIHPSIHSQTRSIMHHPPTYRAIINHLFLSLTPSHPTLGIYHLPPFVRLLCTLYVAGLLFSHSFIGMIGCACDCWGPHLFWDCRYEFVFPDDRFTGARCMKYMHYAWRIIPPYWFRSFDPSSRLCSSSIVMAVTSICIFFSSSFPITRLSFSPFFCCFLITFFFF